MSQTPEQLIRRFEPRRLTAAVDSLSPGVRAALPHLLRAMQAMNPLYMRQMGTLSLWEQLRDRDTAEAKAFWHFKGPYDKLDEERPFIAGVAPARPGRTVYPADLTADELEQYLQANPAERAALLDPYAVVKRDGARLVAVPYATEYADMLGPVAAELRAAAALIEPDHKPLADFLRGRADALLGARPMRDTDAEWVRLALPPLEVVIGPYEVYQDHLRGVKAFYEGVLLAVVPEACQRLAEIERGLGELAKVVPCPFGSRGAVGGMAPLIVADELVATGDGHAGVLSAAFNLPNDPDVRGAVGWKQILIRNVMQAKFEVVARRIAERVFTAEQLADVSFDAFFHHVLLHEVSHGLGPQYRADGRSVNEACGRSYSALEEAKADVGALVLLLQMGGKVGLPAFTPGQIGASYLAGLYRSARFGLAEAHGKANVVQFCFLHKEGAIKRRDGRVFVDAERLPQAAQTLLQQLTELQAAGNPSELESFLAHFGRPPRELAERIASLADLPVDVRPEWETG